jgi:hypothetical protein
LYQTAAEGWRLPRILAKVAGQIDAVPARVLHCTRDHAAPTRQVWRGSCDKVGPVFIRVRFAARLAD